MVKIPASTQTDLYTHAVNHDSLAIHHASIRSVTVIAAALIFAGLVGCNTAEPNPTPSPTPNPAPSSSGPISGSLNLGLSLTDSNGVRLQDVIPGRLIVKFKPGLFAQGLSTLQVNGQSLERLRSTSSGAIIYRSGNSSGTLSARSTLNLVARLKARADVLYAEPDRKIRAFDVTPPVTPPVTPTDSRFPEQWNLQAPTVQNPSGMNLPAAWGITTGNPSTVIAIVDTGILGKPNDPSKTHPEFTGRVLPGFDFVSDLSLSNDGDARDTDPFDPGDSRDGTGSYHGSVVAGIAAAGITTTSSSPNASVGMAGVNPNTSILPVRALGVNGEGSLSDVLDAITWAAGSSVPGIPANSHPADVINLSLGDRGACSSATQDAINTALSRPQHPVIVVAAGNDNADSSTAFPTNCAGVIGVGALNAKGERALYSNYGSGVSVMAPGGDFNTGGQLDPSSAILGASWNPSTKTFAYQLDAGTSMAAPHVAGLIALIKGVQAKPADLTTARTLEILRAASTPLTASACRRSSGTACGAGLIDAARALGFANGTTPLPNTDPFTWTLTPSSLTVQPGASASLQVNFNRSSAFTGPIAVSLTSSNPNVTAQATPASVSGDSSTINVQASQAAQDSNGDLTVRASSNGFTLETVVRVTVPPERTLTNAFVIALKLNTDGTPGTGSSTLVKVVPSGSSGLAATIGSYSFVKLEAGRYVIVGVKDVNANKTVNAGDYLSSYTTDGLSTKVIQPPLENADFDLELLSSDAPSLNSFSSLTEAQRVAVNMILQKRSN